MPQESSVQESGPATVARLRSTARLRPRGFRFEEFEPGRHYSHHWGRTLTQADNLTFSLLTMHYCPVYTNAHYAKAQGHPDTPVNPLLVFNTVFGLSVEDLSEGGGSFLGIESLDYLRAVYPGDTLYADSEVLSARVSDSRPNFGIATWRTTGLNQHGDEVITFERSNLLRIRT